MMFISVLTLAMYLVLYSKAQPQPEINDQYATTTKQNLTETTLKTSELSTLSEENEIPDIIQKPVVKSRKNDIIYKVYRIITGPIEKVLGDPKVGMVFKNIGTCIVNGVMEILSYYIPTPLMPLIATAAGVLIPFEPVVTLRRRMPVTSYRRAFKTAVNSFLNTFDVYKVDDDEDPYMTRRFNRRFLNDASNEKSKNNLF